MPIRKAHLQLPNGAELALGESCSIGRTSGNDVSLPHEQVSRRHALIHAQEHGRFCFVDLGSSNGSYINGRRVVQPVMLKDGDQIGLGPARLIFRDPNDSSLVDSTDGQHTLHEIRTVDLWLLVADVVNSSRLAEEVGEAEVPKVMGRWLAECRRHIEIHGGSINKYLGDGLLAYWPGLTEAARVASTVKALREMLATQRLGFRVVVHRGQAMVGGAGSLGEENLTGRDVNFVFRMEKVASAVHAGFLMSSEARNALQGEFDWDETFRRPVQGFDGDFVFSTPRWPDALTSIDP